MCVCVSGWVGACVHRVLNGVCVWCHYFQYSRVFVYPQAHCIQAASQNDLELIALTFMCVKVKEGVYAHAVRLCAFTHMPCIPAVTLSSIRR